MEFVQVATERLGHLFYIVNPFKTTFKSTVEVPHYVSQASLWFFTLIILEQIILRKKRGKWSPMNDSITSISCGLFMEIDKIAFRGAQAAAYMYIYENFRIYEFPWESLWTWIICAFGYDLGYYWAHRAAHEVNLFWSQHQVHHSSEEYNLTTALRQGIWQGWCTFFFYLPMAFFIPPSHYFVHAQFNLLYQFWIHTEIIDDLGPLEWVLNTPSHHRVHHGSTRYCVDKNYAGVLIIWDRMFGTFEAERRREPLVYGLIEQVKSFNPFYLEFFYLVKVFEKMFSMNGFVSKLKAVFFGPGWFPGTPRTGNYEDLPEKIEREKFSVSMTGMVTSRMQLYAAIHFLLLTEGYRYMASNYEDFNTVTIYCCCAYVIASLVSIGLLFNHNSLFYWLECVRCLIFLGYSIYQPIEVDSIVLNIFLYTIRLFYLYSAWMCRHECVKVFSSATEQKIK